MRPMDSNRPKARWLIPAAAAAVAAGLIALGCARPGPSAAGSSQRLSSYQRSDLALDPAIESNWPKGGLDNNAAANTLFASFVRHAETDPAWLALSWRGESVFVRCDPQRRKVVFQDGSNKIEKLEADGAVEALSMRRYVRATRLDFDLRASKLAMWEAKVRRNPAVAEER